MILYVNPVPSVFTFLLVICFYLKRQNFCLVKLKLQTHDVQVRPVSEPLICVTLNFIVLHIPHKVTLVLSLSCGNSCNLPVFESENNINRSVGEKCPSAFLCITNNEAKNLSSAWVFVCRLSVKEMKTSDFCLIQKIGHQSMGLITVWIYL